MKNNIAAVLLMFLLLFCFTPAHYGQITHILETENCNLIYLGKPHEFIVPHLASCFENSMPVLNFHLVN